MNRSALIFLAGLALVIVGLGVTGCTDQQASAPGKPPPPVVSVGLYPDTTLQVVATSAGEPEYTWRANYYLKVTRPAYSGTLICYAWDAQGRYLGSGSDSIYPLLANVPTAGEVSILAGHIATIDCHFSYKDF